MAPRPPILAKAFSPAALLLLLPLAATAAVPARLVTFNDDGAWNWFQDERVVASGGKLFLASVAAGTRDPARAGAVEITSYDLTGAVTARYTLHQPATGPERKLWLNDHDCPSLLLRSDGRLLAMYSLHGVEPKLYYRISTVAADIREWSEERIFVPGRAARITFPNLLAVPAEPGAAGRLYAFFRGLDAGLMPSWAFSDDAGATWSAGGTWLRSSGQAGSQPAVPYVKYASAGDGAIHMAFSGGHHLDYGNAVYHVVCRAGRLLTSDGAPMKSICRESVAPSRCATATERWLSGRIRLISSSLPNCARPWASAARQASVA